MSPVPAPLRASPTPSSAMTTSPARPSRADEPPTREPSRRSAGALALGVRAALATAVVCALLVPSAARGQTGSAPAVDGPPPGLTGTLIVLNKGGADASFIDLASGRIVATAPTGEGPHELVITADGRTAVGTDYGAGRDGRTLTVLDVPTASVVRTIDLGRYTRPHGIVSLPDGERVAVTSETTGTVVVVKVDDGTVEEVLETGARGSHMVAMTADGGTFWTGDMGSHTVTELDAARGVRVRALEAPETPEAVMVTPSGDRVFAGSNATGRITVWDTRTGEARTVAEGFGWPYRIVLTPGVEQIVIPDLRGEVVRFFDGDTYAELGTIDFAGQGPQGLILHPDGRHLFISLSAADRIAVVDVATRAVLGHLPAGRGPDGIGISPLMVRR